MLTGQKFISCEHRRTELYWWLSVIQTLISIFIYFCCGPRLKSLLNLFQYCFYFLHFAFWPWGMWDLSSQTGDQTCHPYVGRWRLKSWTTREVPNITLKIVTEAKKNFSLHLIFLQWLYNGTKLKILWNEGFPYSWLLNEYSTLFLFIERTLKSLQISEPVPGHGHRHCSLDEGSVFYFRFLSQTLAPCRLFKN